MEKGYYGRQIRTRCSVLNKVAIHNKNGKGLLRDHAKSAENAVFVVAIHNKNGKGLLQLIDWDEYDANATVAIHNKNGKGLLPKE